MKWCWLWSKPRVKWCWLWSKPRVKWCWLWSKPRVKSSWRFLTLCVIKRIPAEWFLLLCSQISRWFSIESHFASSLRTCIIRFTGWTTPRSFVSSVVLLSFREDAICLKRSSPWQFQHLSHQWVKKIQWSRVKLVVEYLQ